MSRTAARGGRILLTSRRLVGGCVRNKADKLIGKLGLGRALFYQRDVLELVKNPFCRVWTTVYS